MGFTTDMILVPGAFVEKVTAAVEACSEWWRADCIARNSREEIEALAIRLIPVPWGPNTLIGIPTKEMPEQAEHFLLARLPMATKPVIQGRDPLNTIFPDVTGRLFE